jgi:hypothetical protein
MVYGKCRGLIEGRLHEDEKYAFGGLDDPEWSLTGDWVYHLRPTHFNILFIGYRCILREIGICFSIGCSMQKASTAMMTAKSVVTGHESNQLVAMIISLFTLASVTIVPYTPFLYSSQDTS